MFARAGSLSERFQAAHQDGDLVRDPLRREYSDGWEAAEAAAAAAGGGAGGAEGGAAAAGSRALSRQGSKAGSTSSRAPGPVEPQVRAPGVHGCPLAQGCVCVVVGLY